MSEQELTRDGEEPRWEKCRTCHAWLTFETELDYVDCPELNPCRDCRPETEEPAERGAEELRAPRTLNIKKFEPDGFNMTGSVTLNEFDVDVREYVEREAALRAGVDLNAGEVPEQDEDPDGQSSAGQRGTEPTARAGAGIEKEIRECGFTVEIARMTKNNLAVVFNRDDKRLERLNDIIDSRIAEVEAEKARLENSLNEKKGD